PETEGDYAVLTGTVPVAQMHGYQAQLMAYSGGRGRLFTSLKGYEPCHNPEEVMDAIGYEAAHDPDNPCGSVFCTHGAGFVVEWNQVEEYMHLESTLIKDTDAEDELQDFAVRYAGRQGERKTSTSEDFIGQDEIEEIFNRTFGTKTPRKQGWARTIRAASDSREDL
ncbi:MAG: translation elongation factor G, partial [Lachnospiraceae bacterium]|nr:translation elongation factor G [Lachnospiraceae bacterium]